MTRKFSISIAVILVSLFAGACAEGEAAPSGPALPATKGGDASVSSTDAGSSDSGTTSSNDALSTQGPEVSALVDANSPTETSSFVDTGAPVDTGAGAETSSTSQDTGSTSSTSQDTGSTSQDTGGSSAGLDSQLVVPTTGASCPRPGDSSTCQLYELCRIATTTDGRCEECVDCGKRGEPCTTGFDCDIMLQCYQGTCHTICKLGTTFNCGNQANCINVGNATHGICSD